MTQLICGEGFLGHWHTCATVCMPSREAKARLKCVQARKTVRLSVATLRWSFTNEGAVSHAGMILSRMSQGRNEGTSVIRRAMAVALK